MRLLAIVLTAVLAVPAPSSPQVSQQQSPTQGVVKKGKVPASNQILKVNLPKPSEGNLANGIHLIVLEDHRLPQISFQLLIPGAGGYFEPSASRGLAGFTSALMREGTATRTSEEISKQLEVMAATLNIASAEGSEASIVGSSLTEQFDKLMDIAADVLLHPTFPDVEVTRYQQRTRAQLMQQRTIPGFLAQDMFSKAVYGDHPASRIAPTSAALDALSRDQLLEFHREHYAPDFAIFAVAGDITMAEVRRLADARFGAWKKSGMTKPALADPAPIAGQKIYFIGRPNSVQTNLLVGTQAIRGGDADEDVLQVMNKIIGGGPTGRLFIHLREEKGYTYGAGSGLSTPLYRGTWSANTTVRTEVTEPALNDLLSEIATLRDVPVPAPELADAKRSMIASFALSLESPAQLLQRYVNSWRFGYPRDYWDKYPDRISGVTTAQIQAAARKYLAPDRLRIVAVGDAGTVAAALKKLGEVETYDADGKKISN
jgi:zinc protease